MIIDLCHIFCEISRQKTTIHSSPLYQVLRPIFTPHTAGTNLDDSGVLMAELPSGTWSWHLRW